MKRCLDSVIDGVDIIFAVDGKFPNFPGDSQLSTDGSGELVKSYSKCLLINSPESEPEYKKWARYIEHSITHSIDILLIIDSD